MMQLVIKGGMVIATHPADQFIYGKYPDAEIVPYSGPVSVTPGQGFPDPRTPAEKTRDEADRPIREQQARLRAHFPDLIRTLRDGGLEAFNAAVDQLDLQTTDKQDIMRR